MTRPTGPVVYAIRGRGAGLVKLGSTADLRSRLAGLRNSSPMPLDLLGYWVGSPADELRVHQELAECRAHGEWFRIESDQQVLARVGAILRRPPQPPLEEAPTRPRGRRRPEAPPRLRRREPDATTVTVMVPGLDVPVSWDYVSPENAERLVQAGELVRLVSGGYAHRSCPLRADAIAR